MWEHLSLQVRRSGVRTIGWIQPVDSSGRVLGVGAPDNWEGSCLRKVVLAEVNGLQNIWLWNVSAKEKRPAIWRRRQVPGGCSGVIPDDALFPFRLLCFCLTIIYMKFFS